MIPLKIRYLREINRVFSIVLKFFHHIKPDGLKVFLFHDLMEERTSVKDQCEISLDSFKSFLGLLLTKGYQSISFTELQKVLISKGTYIKNSFIITFDDANESVYCYAFPLMQSLNIPFIVFISTGLIGKPGFLTEDQIKILSKDPLCTIGSHGCNHVYYRYLSTENVESELNKSKHFLEMIIQQPVSAFSFPYGYLVACSIKNILQVKKSGYLMGFSRMIGTLNQSWLTSKYFLPRINVDERLVERLTKSFQSEAR